MKNKGFTLVEILAVIVILGVLLIVAIPNVFGIQKRIKVEMYCTKVHNIEEAAKLYAKDYQDELEAGSITITVADLIDNSLYKKETNDCEVKSADKPCVVDPRTNTSMDNDEIVILPNGKRYEIIYQYNNEEDEKACSQEKLANEEEYMISLNNMGGTGGDNKVEHVRYNKDLPSITNLPTKEYTITLKDKLTSDMNLKATYAFKGYTKTTDPNSTLYYDETGKGLIKYNIKNSTTIYAKWESASVRLPKINKSGYTFEGWYTAETGGTLVSQGNTNYTPLTKTTILYAHWKSDNDGMLKAGSQFNTDIKTLAGNTNIDSNTINTNIKSIKRATSLPADMSKTKEVSVSGAIKPVYAWFDNGTIYLYTDNDKIYLNSSCFMQFRGLHGMESLDMTIFDASKATNFSYMFSYMYNLKEINFGSFDTSNVTTMRNMFLGARDLTNLNLSSFNTSNVVNMESMFANDEGLTNLDLSNFNTSKVTNMMGMFWNMPNLKSVNLSSFDTSNVTDMAYMFAYDHELESIDVSNFNTSKLKDMHTMFSGLKKVTSIDVSHFDTSNVTNMSNLFEEMSSLTSLNISNFKTSNVKKMSCMFAGLSSITSLDVSKLDTSNVETMTQMFRGMSSLTSLDLHNFNTSNVTLMPYMFHDMTNLTNLNISSFDTSKVTNMAGMFYNAKSLTNLDLSHFNTPNLTIMNSMFENMTSLISLDLSNFDTSKVTNMEETFFSSQKIKTIYVGNKWDTSNVTNSNWMFMSCTSIVGGAGTTYNYHKYDKEYAHIDGGSSNPGYLTKK